MNKNSSIIAIGRLSAILLIAIGMQILVMQMLHASTTKNKVQSSALTLP